MGKGIDLAREQAPAHAAAMEEMRDQLLLVFLHRLGDHVEIPVSEVDATGGYVLMMSLDYKTKVFTFTLEKKQ